METTRPYEEVPASTVWLREHMTHSADGPAMNGQALADDLAADLLARLKDRIGGELPPGLSLDHLVALDNSLRKLDDNGPTGLGKEETAVLFLTEKTSEIALSHGIEQPPANELKDLHTLFEEGARMREEAFARNAMTMDERTKKEAEEHQAILDHAKASQEEWAAKQAAASLAAFERHLMEQEAREKAAAREAEAAPPTPEEIERMRARLSEDAELDAIEHRREQAVKEQKEQLKIQAKMDDPRYRVTAVNGKYHLREATTAERLVDHLDRQIEAKTPSESLQSRSDSDGTVTFQCLRLANDVLGRPDILEDMVRDRLRKKREDEEIQEAILNARRQAPRMEPKRFGVYAEELKTRLQQICMEATENGWSSDRLSQEKRQLKDALFDQHVRPEDRRRMAPYSVDPNTTPH